MNTPESSTVDQNIVPSGNNNDSLTKRYLPIILTAIIFTILGASGMWGYQQFVTKLNREVTASQDTGTAMASPDAQAIQLSQTISIPSDQLSSENSSQQYDNKKIGLKFSYPNNLFINFDSQKSYVDRTGAGMPESSTSRPMPIVVEAFSISNIKNSYDSGFWVWVFENPNSLDAISWWELYTYYPLLGGYTITPPPPENVIGGQKPEQNLTLNGTVAKYAEINEMGEAEYIYVNHDKRMFLIRIPGKVTDKDEFHQILSTFTFGE